MCNSVVFLYHANLTNFLARLTSALLQYVLSVAGPVTGDPIAPAVIPVLAYSIILVLSLLVLVLDYIEFQRREE
jgi:hypothetical protein